ncbi:ATP-grasp domain-containing protein [Fusibacter bizertensis]
MTRIWLNHWFSTSYNIINLIKDDRDFYIIGSNENSNSVIKTVCDEWYTEPKLNEKDYIEFCLDFCKSHYVDVFIPRRSMVAISKEKKKFEAIGVKVMVEDYEMMNILNNKNLAYQYFDEKRIGRVPHHETVTTVEQFEKAYNKLLNHYDQICFKFVNDEGGKSYRLIDNSIKGYTSLFKKQSSRMTYESVIEALAERKEFSPIMVMPYLPDDEVSVDCLQTNQGIVMIPRIKSTSRIEFVRYDQEIMTTCVDVYSKIDLQHPCNIQFKYLNGIPYFLEVNTRMSGGVQLSCAVSGVNIPNLAVNKLIGRDKKWKNNFEEKHVSHIEIPVIL